MKQARIKTVDEMADDLRRRASMANYRRLSVRGVDLLPILEDRLRLKIALVDQAKAKENK